MAREFSVVLIEPRQTQDKFKSFSSQSQCLSVSTRLLIQPLGFNKALKRPYNDKRILGWFEFFSLHWQKTQFKLVFRHSWIQCPLLSKTHFVFFSQLPPPQWFVDLIRFFQYGNFVSYRVCSYCLGKSSKKKRSCVQQFRQVLEFGVIGVMTSSLNQSLCPRGGWNALIGWPGSYIYTPSELGAQRWECIQNFSKEKIMMALGKSGCWPGKRLQHLPLSA